MVTSNKHLKELNRLSQIMVICYVCIFTMLLILENRMQWPASGTAIGFLIAGSIVTANVQILGRGWARLIYFSKSAWLALVSTLFSFLFLGVTAYFMFQKCPSGLMGFALGFACIPVSGCLYAHRLAKQETNKIGLI